MNSRTRILVTFCHFSFLFCVSAFWEISNCSVRYDRLLSSIATMTAFLRFLPSQKKRKKNRIFSKMGYEIILLFSSLSSHVLLWPQLDDSFSFSSAVVLKAAECIFPFPQLASRLEQKVELAGSTMESDSSLSFVYILEIGFEEDTGRSIGRRKSFGALYGWFF